MRFQERIQSVLRSPKLLCEILLQGHYDFTFDQMPISMRRMSRARRMNLIKSGTNLFYRRLRPWNMPLHMQVELTNYCNLRCPVCPTGSKTLSRRPMAMDTALIERLLNEAGPYLLTVALWGWGESLLHPNLSQILRAARNRDTAILLSTNGQNLDDPRVIEALIHFPPTFLIVAIDGLTDETNSEYRLGAKLDPVVSGVRRLAEIKREKGLKLPILHMRYLVMKHNQHELPQVEEFAAKNDFDFLTLRTLSIIDSESPDRSHGNYMPDLTEYRAYDYQEGMRVRRRDYICQQPFWFPSVFADGTVVACEQDYNAQLPMGVMKEGVSFSDIWFGKPAMRIRKIIRDRPKTPSFCRNCPFCDRPTTDASVQWHLLKPQISIPLAIEGNGGGRTKVSSDKGFRSS